MKMDSNELKWVKQAWFGGPIQPMVDYATRRPIIRIFTNLGSNEGWKNSRENMWSRNFN